MADLAAFDSWQALKAHLRPGTGPCPFVVDRADARHVTLTHFSGGRDATYVVVSRRVESAAQDANAPLPDGLAPTIRYAPFVEGTAIIYDATANEMQGKARPFVCDLAGRLRRVYAVLPYQIEETVVHLVMRGKQRTIDVAFHDARGERIEAALPFVIETCGSVLGALRIIEAATDRRGRCRLSLTEQNSDRAECYVVRSLLTGLAVEVA